MQAFTECMMLEEADGRTLSGAQAAKSARQRLYDEGLLADLKLYRRHNSHLDLPPWDKSVEPHWLEKVSADYLAAIELLEKDLQHLDEEYEMGFLTTYECLIERRCLFNEGYVHLKKEVAEQRITDEELRLELPRLLAVADLRADDVFADSLTPFSQPVTNGMYVSHSVKGLGALLAADDFATKCFVVDLGGGWGVPMFLYVERKIAEPGQDGYKPGFTLYSGKQVTVGYSGAFGLTVDDEYTGDTGDVGNASDKSGEGKAYILFSLYKDASDPIWLKEPTDVTDEIVTTDAKGEKRRLDVLATQDDRSNNGD
jgi:hypothetical protein